MKEQADDRRRGNWVKAAGDVLGGIFGSRRSAAGKLGRAADRVTGGGDDERIDAARNKVERIEQQQAELDATLARDLLDVEAKWATAAADLTTTKVSAEKSDTKVTQLILVWLPTSA